MSAGAATAAREATPTAITVVALAFLFYFLGRGVADAFSAFILPLEAEFGWSRQSMTGVFATYMLMAGLASPRGRGLVDRFGPRTRSAYAVIPAISLLLALPFFLAFVWADRWPVALLFLAVPTFLNSFFLSATVTFVQGEVHPDRRVISGALLLLVMNMVGLGLGPTYVGMVSDFFRPTHGVHSLQVAYLALAPIYLVASLLYFYLARLITRAHAASGVPAPSHR